MNRFLKHFALIAVAIIAVVACSKEQKREPITSDFAIYLNGYQLVEKSGIMEQFTESNRLMAASMAASEFGSGEISEFVKSVVMDTDRSGFSLTKPAYALINYNEIDKSADLTAVIEVHNADDVDKSIEAYSSFLESNGGNPLTTYREGKTRYVDLNEDGVLIGYNETRLVACTTKGDIKTFVSDALNAPLADLSIFEGRDLALYCNNHRLFSILEQQYAEELAELPYCNAVTEAKIQNFKELRATLEEHSSSVMGLAFENGKVVLDVKCDGIKSEQNAWVKVANGTNLGYLPENTLALLNVSFEGERLMEFVNNNLSTDLAATLGVDSNEFNTGLAVATDAVSSIDGDLTVALNKLSGVVYYGYPEVTNTEAIALADVKDRYIIDNLTMFAGAFLTHTADGNYTFPLSRTMRINLGQPDNKFFAGINTTLKEYEKSATKARWAEVVKDSYGACLLADVKELLKVDIINEIYTFSLKDMDHPTDTITEEIVALADYIYLRGTSTSSGEFVLTLKNKNTNALRQISDIVSPYAMLYVASIIESSIDSENY